MILLEYPLLLVVFPGRSEEKENKEKEGMKEDKKKERKIERKKVR